LSGNLIGVWRAASLIWAHRLSGVGIRRHPDFTEKPLRMSGVDLAHQRFLSVTPEGFFYFSSQMHVAPKIHLA
jgi:hypothetical protein